MRSEGYTDGRYNDDAALRKAPARVQAPGQRPEITGARGRGCAMLRGMQALKSRNKIPQIHSNGTLLTAMAASFMDSTLFAGGLSIRLMLSQALAEKDKNPAYGRLLKCKDKT